MNDIGTHGASSVNTDIVILHVSKQTLNDLQLCSCSHILYIQPSHGRVENLALKGYQSPEDWTHTHPLLLP